MEALYFIVGILFAAVGYGIYLLFTVYKSHTDVIYELQKTNNYHAIQYSDMKDEVKVLNEYISSVKDSLEKDSYQSIVEVKQELKLIGELATRTSDNLVKVQSQFEADMGKQYTRMNDLANKVQGLSQDPNFLQRYS